MGDGLLAGEGRCGSLREQRDRVPNADDARNRLQAGSYLQCRNEHALRVCDGVAASSPRFLRFLLPSAAGAPRLQVDPGE